MKEKTGKSWQWRKKQDSLDNEWKNRKVLTMKEKTGKSWQWRNKKENLDNEGKKHFYYRLIIEIPTNKGANFYTL